MRRPALILVGPVCALAVLLVVNRAVLFDGEQFAFRDASQYYYPLHQRIQQEWRAGHWPLWDPWQNGGQPLLGNPTAAVLYPGKLVFACLPIAWAARLYVIGHTALAFAGMIALARSLGLSPTGASLAALTYAFGAPVLFLYNNLIYLVGAAWVPWGLREVDRLVRGNHPSALPSLALVLALQTLGGDPQASYLTLLSGMGLAVWLTLRAHVAARLVVPVGAGLTVVWVAATLAFAWLRPEVPGWVGTVWGPALVAWMTVLGGVLWKWRGRPIGSRLSALMGAGALAATLAAAQAVPIAEFSALSSRAGGVEPANVFKFSVEPYRLVECLWPLPFGREFPENRTWLQAIPPAGDRQMWEPSLYLGGLVVVLALIGVASRDEQPWRPWLTAVALIGLLAAFGRFGSPLWWVRLLPGTSPILGPHDPVLNQGRPDGFLYDGVGSPYALLSAWLPGFGLFRYPAKLLTFTTATVAVLAGAGWDGVVAGRSKGFARGCLIGLVASAGLWIVATLASGPVVAFLSERVPILGIAGPPDVAGAWFETRRSLAQGTLVSAAGLALSRWLRRPNLAGAILLIIVAIDLATAGSRLIWTAPQASFDALPEVARRIAEAERADPSPGPFRIHRLSAWSPERLLAPGSSARPREIVDWERATLSPLHALPLALGYCVTKGVIDRDDLLDFFHPQTFAANAEAARALKLPLGDPVCYYPERSYDLWGARYLILPARPLDWSSESRGFASFAFRTEVVWPPRLLTVTERERWDTREDWQLVRNKAAYPRAWLVHAARIVKPATDPESRGSLMRQIVYQNDPIWSDPGRPVYNPREIAWIETDDPISLRGFIASVPVEPDESVKVTRHDPERVELLAQLNRPGLVILADTYFPGWRLTIDGQPATILRANRLMRGAAVPAGRHVLVYVYDPWTFRVGLSLSTLGVAVLATIAVRSRR